ncbi:hypothetical protein SAMD00019534_059140 [Acytostelium subglobosum LB1]|uniref:hypothetical protein n=1 Tax=Acytostelium subglobosum LB1 TaxID=1410327 RepID=UPI00064510FE|nr:hypothetical protein SAMD00019534_059140 [Acytostelium subglobosum LB1]GAM22739.1 hypothetical protein SAMD00019534_059140 [Acytostelium subglobosum LB1]|eukprot:XP_012753966.1 hypothetical protein SAMD00019534_059140 [Acytostelium subglobosum LB1]
MNSITTNDIASDGTGSSSIVNGVVVNGGSSNGETINGSGVSTSQNYHYYHNNNNHNNNNHNHHHGHGHGHHHGHGQKHQKHQHQQKPSGDSASTTTTTSSTTIDPTSNKQTDFGNKVCSCHGSDNTNNQQSTQTVPALALTPTSLRHNVSNINTSSSNTQQVSPSIQSPSVEHHINPLLTPKTSKHESSNLQVSTPTTTPRSLSPSFIDPSSSGSDPPYKAHILVVDDDVVQRRIINNILSSQYNVTLVKNAEEAWDTLLKVKYDLVLTDVMMPNVSGFDLLQRINENSEIKDIPVILMSGTAVDYKYANDTIKIGGQDFLTKPIAKELLKKKIYTVLQSIWQKKKEQEYRTTLAQERENRSLLAKQMEAKEHEIEELTKKVSEMQLITREAMESPLVSVTRNIEELLQQSNWTGQEKDIKVKLNFILRELGSSNIYRPSFEKLIKNDSVDPVTKSFLVTEFSSVTGSRRNSIPTFPQISARKDTKEGIKSWHFDVFQYKEEELMPLLVDMFENYQLLETFKIPIEKLQRFIMAVHSLYRKTNRYHNFLHAFDVTQTCYTFLTTFKAAQYLTHLDILSLLIAAMCHDLNHPGFNNTFQVNAQTDLTLLYNDNSVLENHHANLTFKILKNSDCNILESLNEDQYKELRRSVIQLILATDMAFHFEYINKFQHHLNNQPFDRNKKEDRQMILNFLLKCGDISNVARPWQLNVEWSNRVSDEFFQQSHYEKICGYPVTPFMDKTKTTRPRIAADFIDYVASPLFQGLTRFLSDTQSLLELMTTNRQKWQIELQKLEGKKEGEESAPGATGAATTPAASAGATTSTAAPSATTTTSSSTTGIDPPLSASNTTKLPKIKEESD